MNEIPPPVFGVPQELALELYKSSVGEIHSYHELHHKRIAYFTGLITTLFAGIAVGFFQAKTGVHYILIGVACLMVGMIGMIARKGTKGSYRLLLEAITVRAKLEQVLGLCQPLVLMRTALGSDAFWTKEPLVPSRHLLDRRGHKSSQKWVDHFKQRSPHEWTKMFFGLVAAISFLLASVALIVAWFVIKHNGSLV